MQPISSNTRDVVQQLLVGRFPGAVTGLVGELFPLVDRLFEGLYPGYQRSDSAYHDLRHTCSAAEATARLLDGHRQGGAAPRLTMRDVELAIAAILLHDSGYIKEVGDNEGTGAKYTLTHVSRSADYASRLLPALGVNADELRVVRNAIQCTGVNVRTSQLAFHTQAERYVGCAVGTADILSQMAAPNYPERLPALYHEYREAAAYEKLQGTGIGSYRSVRDLLGRTREFYETTVQRLLTEQWDKVYEEYPHHFGNHNNPYLTAIENNLRRIDQLLAQAGNAGQR